MTSRNSLSRGLMAATSLALSAGASADQIISGAGDATRTTLTVYQQGVAHVLQDRELELPAGRHQVAFRDVPDQLRVPSLVLGGKGLSVKALTLDPADLTPQSLVRHFVGQEVLLYRSSPLSSEETYEKARILSASGGIVVEVDGRVELLSSEDVTQIAFPNLPAGLNAEPTLEADLVTERDANGRVRLSYLTGGVDWSADYAARLNADYTRMDVQGWVSLTNNTRTDLAANDLRIVAGQVNVEREKMRVTGMRMQAALAESDMVPEQAGDLYVYTLPGDVTLAAGQSRQVSLVDRTGVKVSKRYVHTMGWLQDMTEPEKVTVSVRLDNSKAAGLGVPMPAGTMRFYAPMSGNSELFIGEGRLSDTQVDATRDLVIGKAFDVAAQARSTAREIKQRDMTGRPVTFEQEQTVTLTNARDEAIVVQLEQRIEDNWRMLSSSADYDMASANRAVWSIRVPARGDATLTFRVQVGN